MLAQDFLQMTDEQLKASQDKELYLSYISNVPPVCTAYWRDEDWTAWEASQKELRAIRSRAEGFGFKVHA